MSRAILITRALEQGERSVERLTAAGWDVTHVPCIELAPAPDPEPFLAAAQRLDRYDWIVLTSQNAVARLAAEHPAHLPKIAAIGAETARAVHTLLRRTPDLIPGSHRAEALATELLAALAPGSRLVLLRAEHGRDVLPTALRAAGHTLDVVVAYTVRPARHEATHLVEWLRAHATDRPAAVVLFASSRTVDSFAQLLGSELAWADLAPRFRFACISPITAAALRSHGVEAAVVAGEHTLDGLIAALAELADPPCRP